MPFCRYCGKELGDNELCNCTMPAANPAAAPQPPVEPQVQPVQENVPVAPQASVEPQVQPAQENVYAAPQAPVEPQAQPVPENVYAAPQASVTPQTPVEPQAQKKSGGNVFAPILSLVKGMLKSPIDSAYTFYKESSVGSSAILLGILTGVYMLSVVFGMVVFAIYDGIIDTTSYGGSYFYVKPASVVTSFFYPMIYVSVMAGAVIGISVLIIKVFAKKQFDIKKILNMCAAVVVPLIAACVLVVIRDSFKNFVNIDELAYPFVKFLIGTAYSDGLVQTIFNVVIYACAMLTFIQGLNIMHKELPDRKSFVLAILIGAGALTFVALSLSTFMSAKMPGSNCSSFFALPFFKSFTFKW